MKYLVILFFWALIGCQTTAGFLNGAAEDLNRAGEWIKEKSNTNY